MDRAFRKGHLEIDFPTEKFDSLGELLLRATRLFFSTLPFLAAVTLIVYLPAKLALQSALYALDVPGEGILSYFLMDSCDLIGVAPLGPPPMGENPLEQGQGGNHHRTLELVPGRSRGGGLDETDLHGCHRRD